MISLGTLSADGSTAEWTHPGGDGWLSAAGTWGSGTLTLEFTPDSGTTWLSAGVTLTADGIQKYDLPPNVNLRATLSGATTPSIKVYHKGLSKPTV